MDPPADPVAAEAEEAEEAGPRADGWRLNVLGAVELCYDGQPVEVSGLTRTLLALLARTPGEEVATASIVAGMWGSAPPEDSENEVASHVSKLRRALTVACPEAQPTRVVLTMPAGYILAVPPSNADVLAFERCLADGRRALSVGQATLALNQLTAGLALWRGPAFADFGEHAIVRAEAARLEDLRLTAIESRVDAELALSAPDVPAGLADELRALTGQYWHRERFWTQLMTVLFRTGHRGDALAVFRQAVDLLADGLGAVPGADLRGTERAVLASDPALFGQAVPVGDLPEQLTGTMPACFGRDEELAWLLGALDLAATRRAQARLVVGSPGIGKSRLVAAVAQAAARRGAMVTVWSPGDAALEVRSTPSDQLSLVIAEDLDQATHEDVNRVANLLRGAPTRPVVVLVTCRDPVRVGELAGMPKLVLSALDDHAVADIVRVYAPTITDATAASAMINAGGVPARVHRAASEWAFARAGRRIDRAAAEAPEPARRLRFLRDEVIAGVHELAHVRARAKPLRSVPREPVAEPYRGLVPLGAADADIFHGREQQVAELVARLVEARLLAVVGEVGTGASSLVLAGLLPALAGGVLPDSARWRTVVVTPAGVPTAAALADALAPPLVDPELAHQTAPEPEPAEPERAEAEPAEAKEEPEEGDAPVGLVSRPVLLVVDQFEEVFTALDRAARAEFLGLVRVTAEAGRVILVLRSDFYGRCAEHPELARLVAANTVLVRAMDPAELRDAIELPAVAAGLSIEDGLVDRLVADAGRLPGSLAHLAAALRTTWQHRTGDRLTLAGYREGGGAGLAAAVAAHGERALAALPGDPEREQAARILVALTASADGRLVRRRAPAARFPAPTLARLVEHGLVAVHPDRGEDGGETVEIAHEALVEHWPRLRAALADEAADRSLRRHLADTATAWADGGRDAASLYRGARLAAALDLARSRTAELSTAEHDFLGASQRVVLAAEIRRRRRVTVLWRWLLACLVVATLAVAVAAAAVVLQVRAAADAARVDAQRLATAALAEPDPRRALLLAVASSTMDGGDADAIRAVFLRNPDLIAAAGTAITALAASPDGHTVAVGTAGGDVLLYPGGGLGPAVRLDASGTGTAVTGLVFTPDSRRLASWAAGVVVWDLAAKRPVGPAFGQTAPGAGGLLADGVTLLATQPGPDATRPATTVAWNLDAGTPSTAYQFPAASAAVVAPGGRFVAFATAAGTSVVEPSTGNVRALPGATRPLAVSADGRTVITANVDVIGVWDVEHGTRRGEARQAGELLGAAFAPDGAAFATIGADAHVTVWDAAAVTARKTFGTPAGPLLSFAPDGRTLYAAGDAGVYAWDLAGGRGAAANLTTMAPASLACTVAGRDLTPAEWLAVVPRLDFRTVCAVD